MTRSIIVNNIFLEKGIGSTVAITDENENIVNKYSYDIFGAVINSVEGISNPFKYVGAYGVMDEGNGLLYMRARYYDWEAGRFISKDPIGLAGGINQYSYANSNPVNRIDPSGLADVSVGVGGTLGIIDVSGDSNSTTISLTTPQVGGGINITVDIPENRVSTEPPIYISLGWEHFGITFAHDFSSVAVNIGLSGGPSPVNMSAPIYTINWGPDENEPCNK